ncbi:MAG: hypothetical protein Q4G45_02440 [Actinomycetia bacterium]|nr:hypothetical protein [Actinomycetes bacterium]
MTTAGRAYVRRLTIAMASYTALLLVALLLANRLSPGLLRYAVMLLVVPPMLGVVWAVVRLLREADEFQSRSLLESLAIAFAGGSLTCFTYGLLEVVGAPHLSWMLVWAVYAAWWLVGSLVVRRHYS